jgi:hypothetical protein
MEKQVTLRIIIEKPVSGIEYGVQKGKGSKYETIQKQSSDSNDLTFQIPVSVKFDDNGVATFFGPFVQGPSQQRFLYIDIGAYAGQKDTPWSRRLKIPLTDISKAILSKNSANQVLVTVVPGTGKDGGPNCATVKPFTGWKLST